MKINRNRKKLLLSLFLVFLTGLTCVCLIGRITRGDSLSALQNTAYFGSTSDASKAIDTLMQRGYDGWDVLFNAFAVMPNQKSVPQKNKIAIIEGITGNEIYNHIIPILSLGAYQDPSPEVRAKCIDLLNRYHKEIWTPSMEVVMRRKKLEKDDSVKKSIESLLRTQNIDIQTPRIPCE